MIRIRILTALAAFALSLPLFGCGPTRLHILITDFSARGVDGLRLYRVEQGGTLVNAGTIAFGNIVLTAEGLQLEYTQYSPDNTVFGPLTVPVALRERGQVELELAFLNRGAPGYFRFASYNEHGTSQPTMGRVYSGNPSS